MMKKKIKWSLLISIALSYFVFSASSIYSAGWLTPEWYKQYYNTYPSPQVTTSIKPQPTPTNSPQISTSTIRLTSEESSLIEMVNLERKKRNISPLLIDTELVKWARIKSQDMIDNKYFAHISPTYGSSYQMLKSANIPGRLFGENISKTSSVIAGMDSFMKSSVHCTTLLNNKYTHTGVGIVISGRTYYITQLFVAR